MNGYRPPDHILDDFLGKHGVRNTLDEMRALLDALRSAFAAEAAGATMPATIEAALGGATASIEPEDSTAAILRRIAGGIERCGRPIAITFYGLGPSIALHTTDLESWAEWVGEMGGSVADGCWVEHSDASWSQEWQNDALKVFCLVAREVKS